MENKKKQINKKVLPNQKRKITRVYGNITENEKTKKRKYAHNENKNMSLWENITIIEKNC